MVDSSHPITVDPRLSSLDQSKLFIVNLKRAIIGGLRATLDDKDYPDQKIGGIKVGMEFPMEETLYPHIWVDVFFSKFQNAGIGHYIVDDGIVKGQWYFEGGVRFTIMALTSYERDTFASQLIQLFAFGNMNPITQKFYNISRMQDIYFEFNHDSFQPEGAQLQPGTPWDNSKNVYTDTYSMNMIGQIDSNFETQPGYLSGIEITATGISPSGQVFSQDTETYQADNDGWQ
jgi:hypothetical protein